MPGGKIVFSFPTVLKHKKSALGQSRRVHGGCTLSLIGLWCYKKCGVKTLMIIIIVLGGAMHNKNERLKEQK